MIEIFIIDDWYDFPLESGELSSLSAEIGDKSLKDCVVATVEHPDLIALTCHHLQAMPSIPCLNYNLDAVSNLSPRDIKKFNFLLSVGRSINDALSDRRLIMYDNIASYKALAYFKLDKMDIPEYIKPFVDIDRYARYLEELGGYYFYNGNCFNFVS